MRLLSRFPCLDAPAASTRCMKRLGGGALYTKRAIKKWDAVSARPSEACALSHEPCEHAYPPCCEGNPHPRLTSSASFLGITPNRVSRREARARRTTRPSKASKSKRPAKKIKWQPEMRWLLRATPRPRRRISNDRTVFKQ